MTLEKVKQGDVACSSKGWPDCHCHYQEGVTDANDFYSGMGGCLTDYQGDANDFYKSGGKNACRVPAYCHSNKLSFNQKLS